jgi:hypothetical protein
MIISCSSGLIYIKKSFARFMMMKFLEQNFALKLRLGACKEKSGNGFYSRFRTFYTWKTSLERKTNCRSSCGVAARSLDEIWIQDISAVLSATELKSLLPFIIWAGLVDVIHRFLKFWENSGVKKFKNVFVMKLYDSNFDERCLWGSSNQNFFPK